MRKSRIAMLVVALLLMALTYAFAAGNSVSPSKAGDGSAAVGGYTVTNVQYTLLGSDPSKIDAVQFDLDAAARTVYAALSNDGTTWSWSAACNNTAGNTWQCDFNPDVDVQPTIWLRVVAAE